MTTRTLVLMRHGKSDWTGEVPDRMRPIGKRGMRQAAEAGAWLAEHFPELQLAVISTAVRARMTWDRAAAAYDVAPPVRAEERLYSWHGAEMLSVVREIDDGVASVVVVGHNPGLDELVAELVTGLVTGLSGEAVEMVTSALAVLRFEGSWGDLAAGSCELTAYGRPPA